MAAWERPCRVRKPRRKGDDAKCMLEKKGACGLEEGVGSGVELVFPPPSLSSHSYASPPPRSCVSTHWWLGAVKVLYYMRALIVGRYEYLCIHVAVHRMADDTWRSMASLCV